MKLRIKIVFLLSMCLCLEGCMEAAIRFWNGPGWSSPAREKADQECFDELQLTVPKPNAPRGSEARTEWLINVYTPASIECMKRKGF
ncbi:hypothetical protein ABXR98_18425 [Snodgrassella alvi]|uniref:hypothetical protein n=1 Tax=Snodgrassella TaxID=1193515 RepID=UPI001581497F|nr:MULTISPECIES: hypothetical protein [Snodgrassella]NUE81397.1 hypothetical protein [Snodgrassella sp. ESL0304]WLT02214.1 hypothetical protein RAM00_10270 [Snodgrassella alvi]